ncbi:MAG: hypothetical protein DHS20C05_13750 [Hyphococcus sp.]|nr:MAG: hypothetical protein DHS20C05_13750 [Marinicaulis sp.]
MVERVDNSRNAHEQIQRLFADITNHLEAAHQSAVAGQAVGPSAVELLADLRKSMRCASSLADQADALLSKNR